ncbi:T9SS type A sorting domain-containing protein [Algoriphagus confluentis]|uniref:Secretion system C-terminal sorting domain-containing protein n=1 Tax=Algoriphagus confluentis TaxID=1697556 RepID=A0ABQ6PPI8_9BACT|nr:hypothetical protein Aconfl_25140 [Algoriphagus confluentis]
MKKNSFIYFFTLLFLLLFWEKTPAFAQFVQLEPIEKIKISKSAKQADKRLLNQNSLPFWDDFSKGIDTTKWSVDGISYTETAGNNPPTLGMILFNGVDQNGRPYSLQDRDQGESDYFTSKPFDLSGLSENEKNSLFISFFWQAGGKSEAPDTNDELILQVLTPEQNWMTVWSQNGGDERDRENFTQEILAIEPQWQHDRFQFRFLSSGRLSGPFDAWLLDYVYLNSGRNATDLTYPDRAITQPNFVQLGDYRAYPWELLDRFQEDNWSVVSNEFLNLENRFRAMEFTISATDSTGQILLPINSDSPFNPVPNALERRSFFSREFETIPNPGKSLDLYFETYLTTGDDPLFTLNAGDTTFFEQVNFADNDTVSSIFPLRDFFAYDGGSADYSAGINQRSGQLAVKYQSPEPVLLYGISINFTNASQANQAIDLVIWEDLSLRPIFSLERAIPVKQEGQEFIYFPLDTAILVGPEFYVGFTQFTNNFIHVGLDKTNIQADRIFYNVGGGWVQNEDVLGSLMIRPHVKVNQILEGGESPQESFLLYPNPVRDKLIIRGKFAEIQIYDSFGRQILLPRESLGEEEMINFGTQRPGIYIVNLVSGSKLESFRIQVIK